MYFKPFFAVCPTAVTIKLKNDAKEVHEDWVKESIGGTYRRYRDMDYNGRSMFKKGSHYIWYYAESKQWLIGPWHIFWTGHQKPNNTKNKFGEMTDEKNVWRYYINNRITTYAYVTNKEIWKTIGKNDIIIENGSIHSTFRFIQNKLNIHPTGARRQEIGCYQCLK